MTSKKHLHLMAILFATIVGVSTASAAEAVGIDILQDGKQVAGYTITWTGETEAELWMNLKETRLTFERDFEIPVDPKEENKATLTGKIEIRAMRRGRAGTSTTVDRLRLKRSGSGHWMVDGEDVEATLKSAGLKVPVPRPQIEQADYVPLATWVKVGMVGFALFLACVAWVKRTRNSRRTSD
ncbi:MAG: hypothetical protein H8E37_00745 [Planctomycetes bacterium]|nr:hypothetical protein [Planctomycetota bacterium]